MDKLLKLLSILQDIVEFFSNTDKKKIFDKTQITIPDKVTDQISELKQLHSELKPDIDKLHNIALTPDLLSDPEKMRDILKVNLFGGKENETHN